MTTSVLIVEDEPSILELISYTCRTSGMEVRKAANVAEAKKNLEAAKPDIILLDWMLPDCAGLEWLYELRRYHSNESLPVIMLTARGQEDDRVRGLEAGADDYVTKPFSPRELVARIRAVIRRKGGDALPDTLRVGPLEIDAERYEARVNDKPLRLSAVELNFFRFLPSIRGAFIHAPSSSTKYGASVRTSTKERLTFTCFACANSWPEQPRLILSRQFGVSDIELRI